MRPFGDVGAQIFVELGGAHDHRDGALLAPCPLQIGTPKAVVDLLNAEVVKIVSRADLQRTWGEQGAVSMIMSPSEFDKYLRADIAKWAHVVEVSGAKVE